MRRLFAASESLALGHGGVTHVAKALGLSRRAIHAGITELKEQKDAGEGSKVSKSACVRIRKVGGGRKRVTAKDPALLLALEALVSPTTRGDPESPLLWTIKSLRTLSNELKSQGHIVSHPVVGRLLEEMDYSLQGNKKTLEGEDHPDRNAQFEWINEQAKEAMKINNPVISVDTKKKELVGPYHNRGKSWRPKGTPEEVKTHDFVDPALGRANPYGIYDLLDNTGWVSVGTDHDTASFAVETIRRWWNTMGKEKYPKATELMITADGGGSNGRRVRLWKLELQRLANELGFPVRVSHFPPGTSKWNKIEHRMFSFISLNWRGKPLISHEVIVNLIANTTTKTGLKIHAELDDNTYPIGIKVENKIFKTIKLLRESFHGEWNYLIAPNHA